MSFSGDQRDLDGMNNLLDQSGEDLDAVHREDEEESCDEDEDEDEEDSDDDDDETDDEEEETEDLNAENADNGEEGDVTEEDEDADENEDSEESGEEEEEDEEEEADNADSSSGDENSDRCPICLNRLRKQDIGTPESCDHSFCLECIQEWAKNVNTCPVDRQVFRIILARHEGEEKIFKQFPVEDRQQGNEDELEDPTYCEVCGQSNREDRLLLCDRCDLGYHCDCLTPPLASVPVHEWFCPDCQQSRNTVESEPHSSGRQIARTRISERVRRLIAEARAERAERRRRVAAMIEAQEALEEEMPTPGPSSSGIITTSAPVKKKTTVKRKKKAGHKKTTRKKKTTKKRKTKKTGKKTRRKRKVKGKGKRKIKRTKKKSVSSTSSPMMARTAISRVVTSVKGRIADKLGLSKPPAGRSIPLQKLPPASTRQEGSARSFVDHGVSSFSILGSKDELYLFADQEGEERQPVTRPAIPAETLLSRSAKSSHKPLTFSPTKKKIVVKETAKASPLTSPASGGFDLLGSILQNQDLLHKGSKHVTINRDGSLSAKGSAPTKAVPTETSTLATHLSSSGARASSLSSSSSFGKKYTDTITSSRLLPAKTVSFNSAPASGSDTGKMLESGNDVHNTNTDRSNKFSSLQPDLTSETAKFSEPTSSDEELLAADTDLSDKLVSVKNEGSNVDDQISTALPSQAKSALSGIDNFCVEGIQTFTAVKSEVESENSSLGNVDCGDKFKDCYENIYYSDKSSSESIGLRNGTEFRNSFNETPVIELENNILPRSESSLSQAVGSRESDSLLAGITSDSPRIHVVDVTGGDLEAEAVFCNNAHLNAEEDAGNNGSGLSTTTNSQADLRNFAAVANELGNVHDDSSVGIMKRNFNILVSTSSNLAGYESGEENENIERYMHHSYDREEGEASDSNDDGEVRENEDRQRTGEDQEEGEIVEEEERDRWAIGRNVCEEEGHEDSEGLDVNAIHIEEMEIGTFRKRSMSQNEDNNNEGNKKMKKDEGTTNDTEIKQDNETEKDESDDNGEEDSNDETSKHRSFSLASLLSSLKTNEQDENKEKDQGAEETKEDEGKKQEEQKETEDLVVTPINILDFIGDANARKFGLQIGDNNRGKGDQSYGQSKGSTSFGYRDSRPNGDRRRNHWQRERRADNIDVDHQDMEAPLRPFERRRGSVQEEDRDGQRSRSRDSRGVSQRSDSHERWSKKNYYDRDIEKRRGKGDRDRTVRSRSHSRSPSKRGEKRRKDMDHEDKSRLYKNGKRSRRNHEDREHDEEEEDNNQEKLREQDEEKKESSGPPTAKANGYPAAGVLEGHPQASGDYHPHRYPPAVASYTYSGVHVPPLPSHPLTQPPPNHPHAQTHPALPYSQSASLGQPPYSQAPRVQTVQQIAQIRPPQVDINAQHHQGYQTSYYSHSHPPSITPRPLHPPPHPYPRAVYPGPLRYPSQPGQPPATLIHSNPHMAAASQPHSGYMRHPQVVSNPYQQAIPQATYPRPVASSTAPPATYTSPAAGAASVYPPPQPQPTSATPSMPHYSYPSAAMKQEPSVTHSTATTKQGSGISASVPVASATRPDHHRVKETVKESSPKDVKPARSSYISQTAAPIKGVTTYDKVDSSILLNEVKKGFRQLVEDAVRCALKSAWSSKKITKDEYKDIFKRAVEKVCGSKETVVHQEKIQSLINAYVMKARKMRKNIAN